MIKVNLAPPTTKRPRRAAASGPELNLGLLFGGILAALVLIIGGWWLAMSLEQRRLSAALRENLKRRKAQEKGRAAAESTVDRAGAAHDSAGIGEDKRES